MPHAPCPITLHPWSHGRCWISFPVSFLLISSGSFLRPFSQCLFLMYLLQIFLKLIWISSYLFICLFNFRVYLDGDYQEPPSHLLPPSPMVEEINDCRCRIMWCCPPDRVVQPDNEIARWRWCELDSWVPWRNVRHSIRQMAMVRTGFMGSMEKGSTFDSPDGDGPYWIHGFHEEMFDIRFARWRWSELDSCVPWGKIR